MTPLTQADVNSARFDQPSSPVLAKLIICSTPRSGSYLLCRAMIHHGIGIPHEYLNGRIASIIAQRFGLINFGIRDLKVDGDRRRAYLSKLQAKRTMNGIFAAKIHGHQYAQYLQNAPSEELFAGAKFIYLFREDVLAQAISFHVSMLTGRWDIGGTVTMRPDPNPQFFDRAAIDNRLQILAHQNREWRLFFARRGEVPLSFSYEAIKHALRGALWKIAAYARMPLPSDEFNYAEPVPREFRGPCEPSKAEIRQWFLQPSRLLKKSVGEVVGL